MIETDQGPKPVQWLRQGDRIATMDNGYQPLVAALSSRYFAYDKALPIRIEENALNNDKDLFVSPLHHVLIADPACELLFGEREVFVAAKDLVGLPGIQKITVPQQVAYYHLLLEDHGVIYSDGHPTESFLPGDVAMLVLKKTRNQMKDIVAEYQPKATSVRLRLKHYEARVLIEELLNRNEQMFKLIGDDRLDQSEGDVILIR